MEVILIESETFKRFEGMFLTIQNTVTELAEENKQLKADKWLSIKEAAEHTGFGLDWLHKRKELIGYFQDGKDIKFKKEDIDAYFKKNTVRRKSL